MNLATSQNRWRIAPIVAIAAAVMMAVTWGARASALDEEISISAEGLSSSEVTVLTGETVTWTNDTEATLTIVAEDGTFDSGEIAPGETFEHSFMEEGSFEYSIDGDVTLNGVVMVETGGVGGNGNETPAPPATGSGLESSSGVPAPLFIAVGLALLAIAGGSFALSRK